MENQTAPAATSVDAGFDRLNKDWYFDKAVQVLVFIGGCQATAQAGISTAGLSKAFSLAGLRMGWLAAPHDVLEAVMIHLGLRMVSVLSFEVMGFI